MREQPVRVRARVANGLLLASRAAFAVAIFLAALTPYWQGGILSRWPLARLYLGHDVYPVGALVLLPVLAVVTWLPARLLELPRRRWLWGPWPIALPVLGFGAIVLLRIWPLHDPWAAAIPGLGVLFFWSFYLYVLQDWPTSWAVGTLAGVLLVQGSVATLQFLRQSSVGLGLLGEFRLDPAMPGIAVIESGEQRWLRAYGLTSHPNALGGYLGLGFLVCLGALLSARGWRRWGLALCLVPGGLGLFFSFSRAAWLATLAGLGYLLLVCRPWTGVRWTPVTRRRLLLGALLLLLAIVVLAATCGDLLATRLLRLDSPLEYRSLHDRLADIGQAWDLIRAAPLTGVGTGRYREALWAQAGTTQAPGFRMVHSVLFLAAAELGLPGAVLWFWLLLSPPLVLLLRARRGTVPAGRGGWAAAFLGAAVISLLDYYLYMPATWWPAFFMGLFTGILARGDVDGPHEDEQPATAPFASGGRVFPPPRSVGAPGGFDDAAQHYDQEVGANPAMQFMRRVSLATLQGALAPGQRVLEIGCGTGEEALFLGRRGVRVLATDPSPEMLAIAAEKVRAAGLEGVIQTRRLAAREVGGLAQEFGVGSFDGAYSSFGPLNQEAELSVVAAGLAALVKPGGSLVVGVLNRFYPFEVLWYLLHGRPRTALRRWKGSAQARVSPALETTVPVCYYTPRALARAMVGFDVQSCRALPLLLPPPYLPGLWLQHPRLLRRLEGWEERLAPRRPWNGLGDHFLMVLRRLPAG